MSHPNDLSTRLATLERRVRHLAVLSLGLGVALLTAAAQPSPAVLRAEGLVIVDAEGRERLVLGAPMARASEDPRLAGTVGMAILDSAGQMAVSVGAGSPLVTRDGTVGTRIAGENGLIFYDPRNGQERGGVGAFADGRANICLDYAGDKEAACMTVAPGDQYAAVLLNGTPAEEAFDRVAMFVGADGTGQIKAMASGDNRGGVIIGGGGTRSIGIRVYDSTFAATRDLVDR